MSIHVIGVQLMRAADTPDLVIKLQVEENKYVVPLPVLLLFLLPFIITILFSFLDPRS